MKAHAAKKKFASEKIEKLALLNRYLRKILYPELAKQIRTNKNNLTNETF